jgi:hypothetical protein
MTLRNAMAIEIKNFNWIVLGFEKVVLIQVYRVLGV